MSASREKNKRKEQTASPEAAKETKKGMSKGLKTTLIAVCAVLIVCIVVFFYMLTSGFFAGHTTAATVGSHNLSPAMVNYFYKSAYTSLQNTYGTYMDYIIDSDTPLDEQYYDESAGTTWADMLTEQGMTTAAEAYALYDEAMASGYTLSETDQTTIDTQVSTLGLYAATYGTTTDAYIAAVHGTGCNEKNFREYLKVVTVAESYAQQVRSSFTYSDADIADEYAANPNSYDSVTYRQFLVSDPMFQTSSEDVEAGAAELTEDELTALMHSGFTAPGVGETVERGTYTGKAAALSDERILALIASKDAFTDDITYETGASGKGSGAFMTDAFELDGDIADYTFVFREVKINHTGSYQPIFGGFWAVSGAIVNDVKEITAYNEADVVAGEEPEFRGLFRVELDKQYWPTRADMEGNNADSLADLAGVTFELILAQKDEIFSILHQLRKQNP